MRSMKKRIPYLFVILLTAFLAGCVKETPEQDNWQGPLPEGEALVTFSLRFPEPVVIGPATKAMADTPSITSLKIAVFGSSGFLKEYRDVESFEAANTNGPSPVYTFRTKMNLTDSKNLRIHIIANGPDKLPWLYEDAALCTGAYSLGTQDAYWSRFILPNGVMAKREYNETTQAMEYVKRQDPVDQQWYFVVDESVEALFQNIPLIRNFAKLTVESTTPQLVLDPSTKVTVINIPDRGSVAPYNTATSQFMSGYKNISYADMKNEYPGYSPDDMTLTQTDPSTATFTSGSIYMYERPIPTSNPTYLIVHGTYYPKVLDGQGNPTYDAQHNLIVDTTNGTNCYYRIDLTDDDGYYAVYRNFRYRIRITGVAKAGASSPEAAGSTGGGGDVSSNTETLGLTDISDGYGRIMVEYTSKTLVEQTTEVTLKYKFIPDVEHDIPANDDVTITINPGGSTGDVISNTTTISTAGKTTVGGGENGHGIIVIDASDDNNDGFRTLRFSTNDPEVQKKNQTIRISGQVTGTTTTVYRDVSFYLLQRQTMALSCTPSVEDVMGQQVNLNIGIPRDLPESMFPLIFNIEAEKLSLTPYIAAGWEDENLPVESGTTLVPNKSYPSFHFKRTLSYDEYTGTGLYAGNGLPNGPGGVVMTCHFKTNKDQSASNIYVSNEYFNEGSTSFTNYHLYDFTKMYFSNMSLTSVGTSLQYHFNLDDDDSQSNRQIMVTLDGLVPDGNSQLTQVAGTENKYYFTANNSSCTLNLKTESGFNGEYSVKLESSDYHTAERLNSNFVQHSVTLSASNLTAGVSQGTNQSEGWSIDDGETIQLSFSRLNSVSSNNYVELYQNSTMTVDCSAVMSQIQITYTGNNYRNCTMTPNTGSYNRSGNTGTWTGFSSDVIITVGGLYNYTYRNRISSLSVTYWTYSD